MLPTVSIVIPVYNGANYLGEAIESALAQTYPACEIVVVNDGSNDGGATRGVARRFGELVRYVEKPNGGVATALNAGIEAMRGDLFSWLSHDDLYLPWKVERQVEAWRRFGPRCVVIGDFETMDAAGQKQAAYSARGYNLAARPLDAVFKFLINGCALLIPRELFGEAGLFEPGLPTTQDYHLWYRLARLVPFVHSPGFGVRQRMHPLQGSRDTSHLDEASRMFVHLIEQTPPELMRDYDGSELRFLLRLRQSVGAAYPGLTAYLQTRIERGFAELRYAVVWTKPPADPVASAQALEAYAPRPAALAPVATDDPAEAARLRLPAELVAFLPPDDPPEHAQFRSALETLLLAGADAAQPAAGAAPRALAEGTLIWSDALAALAAEQASSDGLSWTTYDPAPEAAELVAAFAGACTAAYHAFVPEAALAEALRAGLTPGRPRILLVTHPGGGTWTHVRRFAAATDRHAECLVCFGEPGGVLRLRRAEAGAEPGGGVAFAMPRHAAALGRILRALDVVRVDVHSALGFEEAQQWS